MLSSRGPRSYSALPLRTAYCVQRTRLLIGGHPVDKDKNAIRRLGLWTILDLRWPLLAQHLARHPDDIALLKRQQAPAGVSSDLEEVFKDPEAAWLVALPKAKLGANSIRSYASSPFEHLPGHD
jgi:hypothetical protein